MKNSTKQSFTPHDVRVWRPVTLLSVNRPLPINQMTLGSLAELRRPVESFDFGAAVRREMAKAGIK
jgi:hypothetical protein